MNLFIKYVFQKMQPSCAESSSKKNNPIIYQNPNTFEKLVFSDHFSQKCRRTDLFTK